MELKWWHKQFAIDEVLARLSDEKLIIKWAKFGLTKPKLRKIRRDDDFKEHCKVIEKYVREKVIDARMRLNALAAGKSIDVLEEELDSVPWNPETSEGDRNYDKKIHVDVAKELIKMSDVSLGKGEEAKGDIIIKLVTDTEVKKESDDGDRSDSNGQSTSKTIHRD